MSRTRAVSSGTEWPRPRLPNEPKNERSLRTRAEVVPPRRANSAEEMVVWPCASNCSRNRRYRESRRTVLSEIFRIVNYFTIERSNARAARIFPGRAFRDARSEEHTSELQSQSNLVCRLLLENKTRSRSGDGARRFRG